MAICKVDVACSKHMTKKLLAKIFTIYENEHQNVIDLYFKFVYYLTIIFKNSFILVVSVDWKGAYRGTDMP